MSAETFLIINAVIVSLLAAYFFLGKPKRPKPAALNLKKVQFEPVTKEVDVADEQELNIYFMYNGYMWDAYEILGVPAGSPMADIEMAYLKNITRIDKESKQILEMARTAIREKIAPES